ncbi:hypothetical protein A0H81_11482, partial [Grifola frondosa]
LRLFASSQPRTVYKYSAQPLRSRHQPPLLFHAHVLHDSRLRLDLTIWLITTAMFEGVTPCHRAWTIFFSLFYLALFLHSASEGSVLTSVLSHGIFLFITWVFWLSGAAAITNSLWWRTELQASHTSYVAMRIHLSDYDSSSHSGQPVYCGQLNALEAFAWITWVFVTFALFIVFLRGIASTRRGDGVRGQLVT